MSLIVRNSVIYLIANITNAAIPFLLLPILTRFFTQEEYGQIAMYQVLIGGLGAFIGLNTVGASARKYYDQGNTSDTIKKYNVNCLWNLIVSSIIVSLIILIFEKNITNIINIPAHWLYLSICMCIASYLFKFLLSQWQVRGKAKEFGLLQVSKSVINVLLSLLLVMFFLMGPEGRIYGQVISFCLFGFIAIFLLFKLNYVSFELPKTSEMLDSLKFGVPLIPHILGMYVLTTIDRVIINNKLGLDNAGVYMLAYQLSLVAYMVFDALNKAYVPWLYEKLKRDNFEEKKAIVKKTYQYFVFLFIISSLMFPIIPFLVDFIVGENFKGVGHIVRWILIGQVFVGMYLMVVNYIFYSKDTRLLSMITIFSGGFHIGLTVIFVDYFGLIGVAYAFSTAMFIRFLLTWFVAMKNIKMPWFSF